MGRKTNTKEENCLSSSEILSFRNLLFASANSCRKAMQSAFVQPKGLGKSDVCEMRRQKKHTVW